MALGGTRTVEAAGEDLVSVAGIVGLQESVNTERKIKPKFLVRRAIAIKSVLSSTDNKCTKQGV
jgi:hypothetical protein